MTQYYEGTRPSVVHEVFGQAYSLGAQMAVIEYRYLDPDYRSEHSRFYSTTFRRYPSVAHRVHFFAAPPPDAWQDADQWLDFEQLSPSYLGFVVLRPLAGARVVQTHAVLEPGAYFGEISLIDGRPRSADVVAGEGGLRTLALSKWTFEDLLEKHPEIAVPMLRVLAARLRADEEPRSDAG